MRETRSAMFGKRTLGLALWVCAGAAMVAAMSFTNAFELTSMSQVEAALKEYTLNEVAIKTPQEGQNFLVPNSQQTIQVGLTANTNAPTDTIRVDYYFDDADLAKAEVLAATSSSAPNFPAGVTLLTPNEMNTYSMRAVATGESQYNQVEDTASFNVKKLAFDPPADSPDVIPIDEILDGDTYYNIYPPLPEDGSMPPGGIRQTVATPVSNTETTTFTFTDPFNPDRTLTVEVPAGLLGDGEQGILFMSAADNPERLLGGTPPSTMGVTPSPLPDGAYYLQITILVTSDDGETLREISQYVIAANPITVTMEGVVLSKFFTKVPQYYSYDTRAVRNDDGTVSYVPKTGAIGWVPGGSNASYVGGIYQADISEVSAIVAPFKAYELSACGRTTTDKAAYAFIGLALFAAHRTYTRKKRNRK